MKKKSIVAFVITYYPDEELLKDNLQCFCNIVDKTIIWDNTPGGSNVAIKVSNMFNKIDYLSEKENKGISYALNIAWKYAYKNDYSYLLTMDQDSIFLDFNKYIEQVCDCNAPKGIYGPEVRNIREREEVFEPTDYVITSGMLISTCILRDLMGYRPDFFVDGIDLEFCLRAKKKGISTYRVANCRLHQRFGCPKTEQFLWMRSHTTNYPPVRLKNIIRNHLIIIKHYPCSFSLKKKIIMTYFWKLPWKILLFESQKKEKIVAFSKGFCEGVLCE